MKEFNCTNFVFSSSATIYNLNQKSPIQEDVLILPTNPYGNTKATVEKILQDYVKNNTEKWYFISLRYFCRHLTLLNMSIIGRSMGGRKLFFLSRE